jgi:hypothetical protein
MATKAFYHDIDLKEIGQLVNFRVHNVTAAQQASIATTLNASNIGFLVYNTTTNQFNVWDGTNFNPVAPLINGAMTFRGTLGDSALSTPPTAPSIGDVWIFDSLTGGSGVLGAGYSVLEDNIVNNGDSIIWNGTRWFIKQGDLIKATQTETNTGTDDQKYITPLKLSSKISDLKLARTYHESSITLNAGVPYTITHNLNLSNQNSFVITVRRNNSVISVDVDSFSVNALTLTSFVNVSDINVTIIGF